MNAKTANSYKPTPGERLVVFVVYPGIVLLDLSGPLQVFSQALETDSQKLGYECVVVSTDGGDIETNTVLSIPSQSATRVQNKEIHTLIVVGGDGAIPGMRNHSLVNTVRNLAQNARRVCSICSGALILGATGLLNGRRAVTHWDDCKMLADEFPEIRVEMDPIFVKDGNFWTSAGITAGIDMALAIVSEDLGRASAFQMARSMVAQMVRSGGQSQYSPTLSRQLQDQSGKFDDLHTWISENLSAELSVDQLAQRSNMSVRNFSRTYRKVIGLTPAKAVETLRVEKARDLLETTDHSLKKIANLVGFNDEERMRRAFTRLVCISPKDYRQNFNTL